MKKTVIFFISIFLTLSQNTNAEVIDCFIVKDEKKNLIKEGKSCETRYSPASTFKIPLALFGYEAAILKDENHPIFKSEEPITFLPEFWSGEKTPLSWMKYSIVWYSQMITKKLGAKNLQNYVDRIEYGNRDLSGNEGKNDGLTEAWLSSSLTISPIEQIEFIEKLANNQLPFLKDSQMKTKNLIRLFDESVLSNGWTVYGKTGSSIDKKSSKRGGYFVGFATKQGKIITFVIHISGIKDSNVGGVYAKQIAIDKMM